MIGKQATIHDIHMAVVSGRYDMANAMLDELEAAIRADERRAFARQLTEEGQGNRIGKGLACSVCREKQLIQHGGACWRPFDCPIRKEAGL
jgi:hypothetical protein